MDISIVIPTYNEAASLEILTGEIRRVFSSQGIQAYEVLLIDDGSTDSSWETIGRIAQKDPRFRGFRFRTNFGKSAALSAGFAAAKGNFVFTLDADLQDDPAEIPAMLRMLKEDVDLVSGWKKRRVDSFVKVFTSRIFNGIVSFCTGVRLKDHNCGIKGYRSEVVKSVRVYGELHRFIPVLAAAQGFRIAEKEVNHRPRQFGKTKFGADRFINGFLDLLTVIFLTDFSRRPLHVLGSFGAGFALLGAGGMVYLAALWVLDHGFGLLTVHIHSRPLMTYSVAAFIFGVQMLSLGLLAELIVAHQAKKEPLYFIGETTSESRTPKRNFSELAA